MLIFKLESAKLWDEMINDMNDRSASVLMRGQIPEIQQQEVQEAEPERPQQQQYVESKQDLDESAEAQRQAARLKIGRASCRERV